MQACLERGAGPGSLRAGRAGALHATHRSLTEPYVVLFLRMGFMPTKTAVGDMMGESGAGGGAN